MILEMARTMAAHSLRRKSWRWEDSRAVTGHWPKEAPLEASASTEALLIYQIAKVS